MEQFLMPLFDYQLLLLVALGTFAGIYVGAIPGLSVTMATVLLLSLTYSWDTLSALALIVGVYVGGVYGGARPAILLNMPGGPAQIATSFDGYPLAQKGEAGLAIGLSTILSIVGGMVGLLLLVFATPVLSDIALYFAHRDYLLLALLGLLLVGTMSQGAFIKSIFLACFGVFIGLVGLDLISASPRLTFGILELQSGINVIIAILGLFGFAEVLYQLSQKTTKDHKDNVVGKIIPPLAMVIKFLPLTLRTSVIGALAGVLPGVGGEIAALLGYDHAKRSTKKPSRPFGTGAYEGVIAPETANNAAIGGAFVPMLTLGIPGDAVTAVIIGALIVHGLDPGPLLITNSPDLFWVICGSLFLANLFLLIFGMTGIHLFKKVISIPKGILMPVILVLIVVGAYSINNTMIDVYWMIGFGLLGFVLRLFGFPLAPLVLGIVLGPLIDQSYRAAMITAHHDLGTFFLGYVTSPISLVLSILFVTMLLSTIKNVRKTIQ
ncbi:MULTISPECIES: tripartite tricarboxylate transporter permease [Shouchella]|uniref:Tripartite tricarboxylate transporter permease n=2 Tax=Shouchella TaxID=2893057 RepID=A0ABY7W562_9BACI|nr:MULTISPECIES: tripartite tricarboxylate transporter permease [Shouchella]MED4128433.1 tripartite tricarboxylate transporter permease [Shouchella miscanthi]WDF02608.1 tripartite tricarboxylate transporter permease [Shouchella hunanensis]